jgi:hypothetical protein
MTRTAVAGEVPPGGSVHPAQQTERVATMMTTALHIMSVFLANRQAT